MIAWRSRSLALRETMRSDSLRSVECKQPRPIWRRHTAIHADEVSPPPARKGIGHACASYSPIRSVSGLNDAYATAALAESYVPRPAYSYQCSGPKPAGYGEVDWGRTRPLRRTAGQATCVGRLKSDQFLIRRRSTGTTRYAGVWSEREESHRRYLPRRLGVAAGGGVGSAGKQKIYRATFSIEPPQGSWGRTINSAGNAASRFCVLAVAPLAIHDDLILRGRSIGQTGAANLETNAHPRAIAKSPEGRDRFCARGDQRRAERYFDCAALLLWHKRNDRFRGERMRKGDGISGSIAVRQTQDIRRSSFTYQHHALFAKRRDVVHVTDRNVTFNRERREVEYDEATWL